MGHNLSSLVAHWLQHCGLKKAISAEKKMILRNLNSNRKLKKEDWIEMKRNEDTT